MEPNSFWSWSMLLWRTRSLEVRASWMLFVWMLFDAVRFARFDGWSMVPFAFIVPPVSMYLHAMAHVGMARLVGGRADQTVLSVINDSTQMSVPLTPAKQFAVAAAGPAVSLVLCLTSMLVVLVCAPHAMRDQLLPSAANWFPVPSGALILAVLGYVAQVNAFIFAFNLLACAIFDGARMWRALLWPLIGLGRAVRATVVLSYVSSLFLLIWGVWVTSWCLLIFGLYCLLVTINEHRSVRLGFDPVLQIEYDNLSQHRRSRSWLSRWNARRRQRAEQRREREEIAEQELLDRLLTKVSEHGLP